MIPIFLHSFVMLVSFWLSLTIPYRLFLLREPRRKFRLSPLKLTSKYFIFTPCTFRIVSVVVFENRRAIRYNTNMMGLRLIYYAELWSYSCLLCTCHTYLLVYSHGSGSLLSTPHYSLLLSLCLRPILFFLPVFFIIPCVIILFSRGTSRFFSERTIFV